MKSKNRTLSEHTAMSYEEWAQCGYYILKGEKSEIRDPLGVPQFTVEQVKKNGIKHTEDFTANIECPIRLASNTPIRASKCIKNTQTATVCMDLRENILNEL